MLSPGANLAATVASAPPGTTFHLKAGVYRLQAIVPKSGDRFIGDPGATLSGARLLSNWVRKGSYWTVGGQTQHNAITKFQCLPDHPGCNLSEDLFINDVQLLRDTSLTGLRAGHWYFDYAAHTIYLIDDPRSHRVETSMIPRAFGGLASNVTIEGLIIEKYSAAAGSGAICGDSTTSWIVQSTEVRFNHGAGVKLGTFSGCSIASCITTDCTASRRATSATRWWTATRSPTTTRPDSTRSAAAARRKFWGTERLTVSNNYVHHNYGKGLWSDTDNMNTVYDHNTVTYNLDQGILHEISYNAVIRNNYVANNGFRNVNSWLSGAGILLASSPSVEIYGNTVIGNAHGIGIRQQVRGVGKYGKYETHDVYIHDNVVDMPSGLTGMVVDVTDMSYFSSRNNRFVRNSYTLHGAARPFTWRTVLQTAAQWKALGEDTQGVFLVH